MAATASPTAANGFGLGHPTAAMLAYLSRRFAPSLHQPGLAPLTPAQLQRQAQGYASAAIQPQLTQLGTESASRIAGGVGQIRGGTANYANALQPLSGVAQKIGTEAANQETAETSALSSFLKGSGEQSFGDVGAKLAAAGIDAPPPPNMGAGSAGITAAQGLASARDSSRQAGNNASFAALLPGLADLQGLQAENQFRSGEQGNLNQQTSQLEAQIPGLTQNVLGSLQQNETNKAQARSGAASTAGQALAQFLGNSVDDQTQLDLANLSGLFGVKKAEATGSAPSSSLSNQNGHPTAKNGSSISDKPLPGWKRNPDGSYTKLPTTTSTAAADRAAKKAQQSALVKADSTTRSILTAALKAASKKSSAGFDFSAGTAGGSGQKPPVGSAAYNAAVNQAVISLATILGPYMSHDEIVQFVQKRALHAGWAPPPAAPPGPLEPNPPRSLWDPTTAA